MNTSDLEEYAKFYLARLGEENAFFALIEADHAILPILVRAFRAEQDPAAKAEILEIIWQHRQPEAIPILSEALYDPSATVWKQALDGLVTLDRHDCVAAIESARGRAFEREKDRRSFLDYLDEAIHQMRYGVFDQKNVGKRGLTQCNHMAKLAVDVTAALAELLSRNRVRDPANPDSSRQAKYGVSASLDGAVLSVTLTFRQDCAYCCYEWGCHLPLFEGKRWLGLRTSLAAHGIVSLPRLELRLVCVIEEGTQFFDFSRPDSSRRGWYAFVPVAACRYEVAVAEAEDATHGDP